MSPLTVKSFIHRTSCVSSGTFGTVFEGKSLTGALLTSLAEKTEEECQSACISSEGCRSINFDDSNGECELNTKIAGDKGGTNLVERTGWRYKHTNYTLDMVYQKFVTRMFSKAVGRQQPQRD